MLSTGGCFCLVFSLKVNKKNKWSTEFFFSPSSFFACFSYSLCNVLFIFFNFFFLLNNFFVEWARPGERPGDEKMGPVRNPSQWGNLPEPPGGPAAGKAGDRCQFKHWYLNFHCCFYAEFPWTSHTMGYRLLGAKGTCYSSSRERGLKEGLDVAEFGSC